MLSLSLSLLTGCVDLHVPRKNTTHFTKSTPLQRQQALAEIQQWKINGALSIVRPQAQPEIANYVWQQSAKQNYHISLSSVLNVYRIVIDGRGDTVTLLKNGELITTATTPERLMQKAVGWSLPIESLQYWIKGMIAPNEAFVAHYDENGHVLTLKQAGWTIEYRDYQTMRAHVDFPQLITLQRPQLSARIVVKQFQGSVIRDQGSVR